MVPVHAGRGPSRIPGRRTATVRSELHCARYSDGDERRSSTYVNPHFAVDEVAVLHGHIEDHRFGTLTAGGSVPLAAHIPFVLHRDEGRLGTLVAHTARADPIARALDGATELLVVFQGPSAYVRCAWYSDPGLPTYNFIAVHVYGRAEPLTAREAVLEHLAELTDIHEASYPDPFALGDAEDSYLLALLPHIAPFTLAIERIEGKVKLSQNRSAADRAGVIAGLSERGGDDDEAIAAEMERYQYTHLAGRPLLAHLAGDRAPGGDSTST